MMPACLDYELCSYSQPISNKVASQSGTTLTLAGQTIVPMTVMNVRWGTLVTILNVLTYQIFFFKKKQTDRVVLNFGHDGGV
jgi:hypothetical protein